MSKTKKEESKRLTSAEVEKLLRQFNRYGYIIHNGRRIEIDHPDSPLRQGGWV